MSRGPGLLCSSIGSTSTSESTCWSLRERVLAGNWKRYKIGDSVVDARRFRFDYLYTFIVFMEYLFFRVDVFSLRWLSCLCVHPHTHPRCSTDYSRRCSIGSWAHVAQLLKNSRLHRPMRFVVEWLHADTSGVHGCGRHVKRGLFLSPTGPHIDAVPTTL